MNKRSIDIGGYNTAAEGWTLSALSFSDPVHDQVLIKIPGSSVTLDMSTVLSDGEPTYSTRTLTATLECSEGTRRDRLALVSDMINRLDGRRVDIVLPDDPNRYVTGRVAVKTRYNDLAHASVSISATCDPWRYSDTETVVSLVGASTQKTKTLTNGGRKAVVPAIQVEGGEVSLGFGENTWTLSVGSYVLPDIYLTPGNHSVTYKGTGTAVLTWREGIL